MFMTQILTEGHNGPEWYNSLTLYENLEDAKRHLKELDAMYKPEDGPQRQYQIVELIIVKKMPYNPKDGE